MVTYDVLVPSYMTICFDIGLPVAWPSSLVLFESGHYRGQIVKFSRFRHPAALIAIHGVHNGQRPIPQLSLKFTWAF